MKRGFVEAQEGSLWASFSSETLGSHERRCPRCIDMCLEGREYVLKQSCADLALWIGCVAWC